MNQNEKLNIVLENILLDYLNENNLAKYEKVVKVIIGKI